MKIGYIRVSTQDQNTIRQEVLMKQLGVEFLGAGQEKLLTAEEVRRRLREGLPIEGRLTPLARDVLEGKL